jgi:hypothetical protein
VGQAFQSLTRSLLSQSEAELGREARVRLPHRPASRCRGPLPTGAPLRPVSLIVPPHALFRIFSAVSISLMTSLPNFVRRSQIRLVRPHRYLEPKRPREMQSRCLKTRYLFRRQTSSLKPQRPRAADPYLSSGVPCDATHRQESRRLSLCCCE